MSTLSLRLRYRPLKIGWCVKAVDLAAIRRTVRLTTTMWGGRFNPIIPCDDVDHAKRLIDLYRVDVLFAPSPDIEIQAFIDSQQHLPDPFYAESLFAPRGDGRKSAQVVDLTHPIMKTYEELYKHNPQAHPTIDLWQWDEADPLADVFLCSYGALPDHEETGTDYAGLLQTYLRGEKKIIPLNGELPVRNPGRITLSSFGCTDMEQHYAIQNHWDYPGFYVGEADNSEDLIHFWNLRAAGIALQFLDQNHLDRATAFRGEWAAYINAIPRTHGPQGVAIWHRREFVVDRPRIVERATDCNVDEFLWNGLNVRVPDMYFGGGSALGAVSNEYGKATVAFALPNKPFTDDWSNYSQHFVVSIDPGIGLSQNEREMIHAPFIPALNTYYGRSCWHSWNEARAEPESLGVITTISTEHMSLRGMNVDELATEIFKSVGIEAKISKAGLVATSLIRQMGGLSGCRAFKIDGVRRLIEDHSPDRSFSRSTAMQKIRGGNEGIRSLDEYQQLYIQTRAPDAELKNGDVLSLLLDKGVFRPGLDFDCPNCQLEFWLSLDDATSQLECTYCGHEFHAAPQLRDKGWAFRRSGLFGRDDHQEGAIPVTLTLQQLMRMHHFNKGFFVPAMKLSPAGTAIHDCETDFVVIVPNRWDQKIQVVIGECKTRKEITDDDVRNLSAVADAFPSDKYDVFIVFARLTPFSPEEVDRIRAANSEHRQRVIMLTERELEPMSPYERTKEEFAIDRGVVSFDAMAQATEQVFFREVRRPPLSPEDN